MEDSIEQRTKRLKSAVLYLISKEMISEKSPQKDIAQKMGATNSTNTNYALNGNKRYLTDNFLKRFNISFNNIFSIEWLLTGKGEMLSEDNISENTNYTKPDYDSISEFNNIEIDMNNPTAKYFMGVIEKLISQGERNSIANERNSIANERNSIANEENAKTISKMVSMLETMLYSSNKLKTKSAGE